MFFIGGLVIAALSLIAAIVSLGQHVYHYFDFVAFAVVIGGTTAVAIIIMPWEYYHDIISSLKSLVQNKKISNKAIILECITLAKNLNLSNPYGEQEIKGITADILKDGKELLSLGLAGAKIETILRERLYQSGLRTKRVANAIRSLAKYPPAFGLTGTVLGLVSLMKAISDGADVKEAGVRMAIALVATFYGLLLSNLLINPAGEYILKSAMEEEASAEIALHTILLISEKTSILETQEILNSYVSEKERVDVLSV